MAQRRTFPSLSCANGPKRDIDKTWQHDLFESYESMFRADEQQSQMSENHRSTQTKWSGLEKNVRADKQQLGMNLRFTQIKWSDLETGVRAYEQQSKKHENRQSAKIHLSNLEQNVSTEDLYDLFSLIGNIQGVHLDCDKYGRSKGTAIIVFERKIDATEAMYRYNGCLLDNKTLKMELMPTCYRNHFSENFPTGDMDVQNMADHFNMLKLK